MAGDGRWTLEGKVALVTGGTRGIGLAIAREMLEHGAAVFVTARRKDELDEVQRRLSRVGVVETMVASAGRMDDIDASAHACVDKLGAIDVLVNNAATNPQFGPLLEADFGAIEKVWAVNLLGPLRYSRAAWELSMKERGGSIINVASVSGIAPTAMSGAYNVGKAGLIHLSRQLALELGPGVRVNTIVPGLIRTRFAGAQLEAGEEALVRRHPLGRLGHPADLAGAALLLATEAGGWMTGQTIIVDGGALQAWWDVSESSG